MSYFRAAALINLVDVLLEVCICFDVQVVKQNFIKV